MRRVTRKPPKMLIPHIKTDSAARIITRNDPDPICMTAPRMMIDEIALVTAISGVCRLCATPQITWKPINTESTNTIKCCIKLAGATSPTANSSTPPIASRPT